MSWSYSRALVEEFSEANCLDTEQFAQLNMTPMPDQFYSHGKTTEHSRLSRFGTTCEPLTESLGEELLTWFLAGFHARTFLSQEKALESTANDLDCGEKWRGWLAKYDPDSCSWKTAQLSLLGDLIESSVILPRSGMTRGGLLWELPMLERPTRETGFGYLLPTPVSIDAGSGRINKSPSAGAKERPTLALMARKGLWPTPTVCGNYNRKGASKTSGDGLATAVAMSLTGSASGFMDAPIVKGILLPTPTAHNAKEKGSPSQMTRNTVQLGDLAGGKLNPQWVEWLMGWPIGHTALKPSETDKCRNVEQQRGSISEAHE